MINWKVRFKNWLWVSSFVSQLMIILQLVLVATNAVGLTEFDLTEEMKSWVLMLCNAIFVALSMLGLVQDPTVPGIGDSPISMKKDKPEIVYDPNAEKTRQNNNDSFLDH